MPLIRRIADHASSPVTVILFLTFFLFSQRDPLYALIQLNSLYQKSTNYGTQVKSDSLFLGFFSNKGFLEQSYTQIIYR